MTQSYRAPAQAGPEHRVSPTILALHIASATSWGRPWRRRTLSMPSPQSLTFQGIQLPVQPLRSWLHLLSRAGMLAVRPAPAMGILRRPEEDEDVPTKIEDLDFEMSTEMILDFAQFAQQSRSDSAEQAEADGVLVASVQDVELPAGLEPHTSIAKALEHPSEDASERVVAAVLADRHEPAVEEPVEEVPEQLPSRETVVSLEPAVPDVVPLAPAPVIEPSVVLTLEEQPSEELVEPSQLAVAASEMPERPAESLSAVEADVLGDLNPAPKETVTVSETSLVEALEPVAHEPEIEVLAELSPLSIEAASDVAEPEENSPAQAVEPTNEEAVAPVEPPKTIPPVVVVSGVRLASKPAVRPQPTVEPEPVAPSLAVPAVAEASLPEADEVAEQPQPEVAEPAMATSAADTHNETVEPDQQTDRVLDGLPAFASTQTADDASEFAFEPMIASLEDALAVLASTELADIEEQTVQTRLAATPAKSTSAPIAAEARQGGDSIPEAAALQGIFIQKETEMTEMRDETVEADAQNTAPISSVELQEVAAALSVPQLEADPDDVLSDVQSTLNSLAGMAQGLTQQKQAAGRLQEELEEWNIQLQERERLAGDKEERLVQLENHLKEAKINLDRMAAENNRLLAERSEALKDLAQTVDLRDKATIKRAESIQLEQQRIDELTANLRNRSSELDERESTLKRKTEELGVRLKQLQSAKDKFSTIVKSFNETVQFNSTLSAISKAVND